MNKGPGMICIAGGVMPSYEAHKVNYSGQHIDAFEIGQYAITLADWESLMDYYPRDTEGLFLGKPIVNVNWYDVHRYIEKLNDQTGERYRLPTEIEWEYAARAGSLNDYHADRESVLYKQVINYDKHNQGPVKVGARPPNSWGCYEMLGNVWEWVSEGMLVDPLTQRSESEVLRGGCWASSEFDVKLTSRSEHPKGENGWGTFGFRVAKDKS